MTNTALAPRTLPPLPSRQDERAAAPDRFDIEAGLRGLTAPLATAWRKRRAWQLTRATLALEAEVERLTDDTIADQWIRLSRLRQSGRASFAERARHLALLRETAFRETGLRAYPVQLTAAIALSDRTAVEMATGEGKTLVTALGAAIQASEGWPVHVITSNDYLALRDLEQNAPLFARLGLSHGGIDPDMKPPERRGLYQRTIVYGASNEFAFDHLRDRIALGDATALHLKLSTAFAGGQPPVMRGLWSAIVDEADSVMIDEARTPLVISAGGGDSMMADTAVQAVALARLFVPERDVTIAPGTERPISLTAQGVEKVPQLTDGLGGVWSGQRRARELIERALFALHILKRDEQYILTDEGKAEIVDENTGRIMPDRTWSDGLHQMVEVKEGLNPSEERVTLGRLTYQRFFRRYRRLSGLSGTLLEARREMKEIYDLAVMPVPTHRPSKRIIGPTRIVADQAAKWQEVAKTAARHAAEGRPVLIGARTVKGAEDASAALTAKGLAHKVLSARQTAVEAEIVAVAGTTGAITVATNMAGRGTDIALDDAARAAGGLVVIMAERHEAGRIDRQLIGRCARQGAPGMVETILAADDDLLGQSRPARPTQADFDRAQARLERMHLRQRADLNRMEEGLDDMISFAGGLE